MAQDYTIQDVKKGNLFNTGYGDMQGYTVALSGVSEPVMLNKKAPVSKDPSVGDIIYGEVEVKTNSKGQSYQKFTGQTRPEATEIAEAKQQHWSENPEKQDSINNAVVYASTEKLTVADTLNVAEQFLKWLRGEKLNNIMNVAESIGEEPVNLDDIPF
jgi:hypothetical protein